MLGQPKRLTAANLINLALEGTPSGNIVVSGMDGLTPQSKIVTFFNPASGTWSAAGSVETKTDGDYGWGCVAINNKGEAFALLGSNVAPIWSRAKNGTWGIAKPTPQTVSGSCALADDGTAMSFWENTVGNDWTVFAASLSPADEWSNVKTLHAKARRGGIFRYGSGFLAIYALQEEGLITSEFDPQLGWLPSKNVTEPGVHANYWSYAAFSPAALMTWNGPGGRVQVSSFDGDSWTSQELGPGIGGTNASISAGGRLAAWLNQGTSYVVQGDAAGNWEDPVKLGATNSEDFGPAATIDSAGNAFAAWPNGSIIAWRRSVHASGEWSDVEEIPDQDPSLVLSTVDSAGNVMLIWQNPLGVWASRFE